MKFVIANIDDLKESEKEVLKRYDHYILFRGLFVLSKIDLEHWKLTENFDDWVIDDFPGSYISKGWLREDIDHEYNLISKFIYNKNEKLGSDFDKILDGNHKTKNIEDVENYILSKLKKWSVKNFEKYNNNSRKLYEWLANEISKSIR